MDRVNKYTFAVDLARLQHIMGKAPLDYIIQNDHVKFLEELAECAAEVAEKASMLSAALTQDTTGFYPVEDGSGGGTHSVPISEGFQKHIDRLRANWRDR